MWNELQAREKTIIQLRSRIAQLEPLVTSSRAEADRLDMINVSNRSYFFICSLPVTLLAHVVLYIYIYVLQKELERKNQELQMIINNLTVRSALLLLSLFLPLSFQLLSVSRSLISKANVEALKQYQLVEQEKEDKTFVSSDEHIQRKRTYKVMTILNIF